MKLKVLHLSLKKEPFDVMVTGEKSEEFRKPTQWIKSRLFNKDGTQKKYDVVKFVNGYGNDKPQFVCEFKGFCFLKNAFTSSYSNGFKVRVASDDIMIILGEIIEIKNIK